MEKKEYLEEGLRGSSRKIAHISSYIITALLILLSSMDGEAKTEQTHQRGSAAVHAQKPNFAAEQKETIASHEGIFKDGIKKALDGLNHISQIPVGGVKIQYYRDSGRSQGQQIKPETVTKLNLPTSFDIRPKSITTPVASMVFVLGDREYEITPDIGMIKSITLNTNALVIEIRTLFGVINEDIVYDKQEKLPDLMYRLWMSPRGKGEKKGFRATTVKEI